MTAFHHACREGKMDIVDLLLQRGANIHRTTHLGVNALMLAAGCGHSDVVKKLVSLRVELSLKKSVGLCPTPLIAAAFRNYPQICGFLIHRGAHVDEAVESLNRLTALSCALMCNTTSVYIFSALLDLGADPYKRSFEKKTVAELAEEYKRIDIINMLNYKEKRIDRTNKDMDIRRMILNGKLEGLDFLKEKDDMYCDGTTPLMYAVINENSQAVKRLLESDVKVNVVESKYGLSALHFSSLLRFDDITATLLMNGADPILQTSFQSTAFDFLLYAKDEVESNLRSMTHTYRPRNVETKLALSASSNALSKMLQHKQKIPKEWISKFSSQLGIATERPLEAVTIEMKQWLESRMHTSPVEGRNHKKLVRLEQLLRREKTVMPPKPISIDTIVDVAKQLANEAQSFNVDCFYDYYDADVDKKEDLTMWPYGSDFDQAHYYSNLYSYQQKSKIIRRRESIERIHVARRESLETIERRRVPPRNAALLEGTSQNQMRTTPRMLKKSRESMMLEAESPRLSGLPAPAFVYQEQLRKWV
ncbi:hypothetical protein WR25_06787 isoform B [Diploscapter pachys]|nr:hypothetical protein WR25_06787 isoform B [Diploscapter pachys]